VADGMGGHSHGEVASRLAVDAIQDSCVAADRSDAILLLRRSIEVAQEKVLAAIRAEPALLGMGTTVVSAMLIDETLTIAHVGDSRCYRARNGELELLTQDHTWVNDMVASGQLTHAAARAHPLRNVITRAIGGADGFEVTVTVTKARPGDLFLLCTDGLNAMLSDDDIAARMTTGCSLPEIGVGMIEDANAQGGVDNITVVLLQVEEREEPWRAAPHVGVSGARGRARRATDSI
ncbi:MAG: serine/threonine-protein phosphatase, partial [bacterium]|nr:serine/threonine-protein phosphatase [bacterium]